MNEMRANLDAASHAIQMGKVLAYPTESVWGLGCDPFNEMAFHELLRLKQRPLHKGVIIIAADAAPLARYLCQLPSQTVERMMASWQQQAHTRQATTWLVPLAKDSNIPSWIVGEHRSVALRVTPHPVIQELCHACGGLLVSTSCNPAGAVPAKTFDEAHVYFGEQVNYLQADTLHYEQPSRIIDAQTGAILR